MIRHDQHRSTQYHESDRFQGVAFGGLLINLFGIMCLREGEGEAFAVARQLMGATDPVEAESGTIRGDLGTEMPENLIHGSDSEESAKREISIFFPEL